MLPLYRYLEGALVYVGMARCTPAGASFLHLHTPPRSWVDLLKICTCPSGSGCTAQYQARRERLGADGRARWSSADIPLAAGGASDRLPSAWPPRLCGPLLTPFALPCAVPLSWPRQSTSWPGPVMQPRGPLGQRCAPLPWVVFLFCGGHGPFSKSAMCCFESGCFALNCREGSLLPPCLARRCSPSFSPLVLSVLMPLALLLLCTCLHRLPPVW